MNSNKLQHLLFCLGEESGEVQQIVGKAGRFGLWGIHPHTKINNFSMLRAEVHDMLATYQMVCAEEGQDSSIDRRLVSTKKSKVERLWAYAQQDNGNEL